MDATTEEISLNKVDIDTWDFKDHLVVVTRYPSADDLYNYAFVHARVKAYQKAGLTVDVFKFDEKAKGLSYYTFEGVRVITGSGKSMYDFIGKHRPKTISCHLLKPAIWPYLNHYSVDTPIYIWLHGSEVQNWVRRSVQYPEKENKLWAANLAYKNYSFWHKILADTELMIHFVFISQYFADEVMHDLNVDLDSRRYSVIHNCINTELFRYTSKQADQRLNILSIRPFAGAVYANDITVSVILDLSKRPFFNKLHFTIVGDGESFDEITKPIAKFNNVTLTKKFLTQSEIANIHRENGIFLVPSRMDTQGVSRDEAMSSGLVPITNNVAAIPEFINQKEGFLLPNEDHVGMADAIQDLYENPSLFLSMSSAAAKRVRTQSDFSHTIKREIELLKDGPAASTVVLQNEHVFYDTFSEREKLLVNTFYDMLRQRDKTISKQNKRIKMLESSKAMRLGRLATVPLKKVYDHRALGLPLRIANTVAHQNSKEIIDKRGVKFGDIPKSPKTKVFTIREDFSSNRNVRVAAVMDGFTYSSFNPECELLQLSPNDWHKEMERFKPDILFIESAWRGKDDKWRYKISNCSKELQDLVQYCNDHNIPTIFWNKEDPAHTANLMRTAAIFDYIFTTDIDVIPIYRHVLGHERIYLLPFAVQPSTNNPIEEFDRKDMFNFAGSYYRVYKERCRDFGVIVDSILKVKGLEIYDRNYGLGRSKRYRFLKIYQPYIIGSLPFSEINKAYKGYKYAITMNTIKYSTTMFARRAFELLASNTITVSNYSAGIKRMLGDLVISSGNGTEILSDLASITSDVKMENKYKLAGLRRVMSQHTYEERFDRILRIVFSNYESKEELPSVCIAARVETAGEAKRIIRYVNSQNYTDKRLILFGTQEVKDVVAEEDAEVIVVGKKSVTMKEKWDGCDFLAIFDPKSYYGPNYLLDILLATKYSDAMVIGKSAYYDKPTDDRPKNDNSQYHVDAPINLSRGVIRLSKLAAKTSQDVIKLISTDKTYKKDTLSVDEFNYCASRKVSSEQKRDINGILDINMGEDITDLYKEADAISNDKLSLVLTKIMKAARLRRTKLPPKM